MNEKLRDLADTRDVVLGDGRIGRRIVLNYKHFHNSVASPSERFGALSALGGMHSMAEVHSIQLE